ncbi:MULTISPECIES: iron-sulfur cluster carrier protein ApbC [unclassified Pseudomonas]|uniref:iron-sulfur cluster carrier protein ApbC n=1 Tax=unclassified Pseudomonas TaxID=196821 RepID=UPI000BCDB917|nr:MULTISPECIES: iron-sulfur cluster carrier protein ApbC [unclassified Pseudomonas]PVZ16305.1 ATP-binding protein involved in chromosome partitioning [Pseudomonas sp. URIL14HWK12:I12]PVZ25839.1 ATP-binding protein involved in chromosome partitioning [Pseudomonas sp. URIL14HWK12:I10]PVZ36637.1 ATP-binding protein involved in chromosome partitioning [Pseudomonas sp. URIL14HWK12:I11]SNZ12936.1 ATP-binding protein involved in chromosome partitioning [Pseudomonas sp. URIL14HWK12:I9]
MSAVTTATVEAALRQYTDPYLEQDPVSAGCVERIDVQGDRVEVALCLGYAAGQFHPGWAQTLQAGLEQLQGVASAKVVVRTEVLPHKAQAQVPAMASVKNIIAVASGKGGVGKSTTAANLALALALEGARVGILDADIYGPSQGIMFGIPEGTRPQVRDQKWFVPIKAHGVEVMSMAFLTDDNTPMVWRGPMVSGALLQLITQTAWDNLDYLVIDMPPGTGDIQLTLSQKVPVAGSVVVTTPQDLALLDARKGVEMFRKVHIPVLGVVENMAVHVCSNCGHAEHLFGEGGGEKLAAQYGVDLLASLPLAMTIREQADGGRPTVIAEPESLIAMTYQQLARHVGARIVRQAATAPAMPTITVSDD